MVNGMTVRNNWDWIVRLEFLTDESDLASLCGGTVIHRNYILTAAHCCIQKDWVLMTFKVCDFIIKRFLRIQFYYSRNQVEISKLTNFNSNPENSSFIQIMDLMKIHKTLTFALLKHRKMNLVSTKICHQNLILFPVCPTKLI